MPRVFMRFFSPGPIFISFVVVVVVVFESFSINKVRSMVCVVNPVRFFLKVDNTGLDGAKPAYDRPYIYVIKSLLKIISVALQMNFILLL